MYTTCVKVDIAIAVLLYCAQLHADTLTLTTGEKLEGQIVSETPDEIQIRLANDDFTIIHVRPIPATNVTAIVRDTPEQRAARQEYEALFRYRLHPDQEQPAKQCEAAIAAMQKYLTGHPAPRIQKKLTAWQTELANVTNGLAKYQNRWMTPAEKQTAQRQSYRQAQLQATQTSIAALRRQLAARDAQFSSYTNALVAAERDLVLAQFELSRLQDFVQPEFSYRPVGGAPQAIIYGNHYQIWSPAYWEKYVSGEKITVHPARASYQRRVGDLQLQLSNYRNEIQTIENKRNDLRPILAAAETALATLSK
jgi:hypothetical protein